MSSSHILLTTDLSIESQRAFAPVAELARTMKARVTLLHVVHDQIQVVPPTHPGMPTMRMNPDEGATRALEQLDGFRGQFDGVGEFAAEAIVAPNVAAAIIDRCQQLGADYIAMATHGHSGIKRLLLGSTAEVVVRHATMPVILYPPSE